MSFSFQSVLIQAIRWPGHIGESDVRLPTRIGRHHPEENQT